MKQFRPLFRSAVLLSSALSLSVAAAETSPPVRTAPAKSYNVLFIAVDDLNDWVGAFGGHPQAITPNMDRLARERGMVMTKAYAPSTVCCPSRSSILTGKRPSSTGVYGNTNNLKNAVKARDLVTLPEYFGQHGYYTLSTGKIFHKHGTPNGVDEGQWAFHEFGTPESRGGKGGMQPMMTT